MQILNKFLNYIKLYKNKIIVLFFLFILIIGTHYYLFKYITPSQRYLLLRNPVGLRILTNWHSARKIINLIHFPYWFLKSDLDTYYITISLTNLNELNSHKPITLDGSDYGRMNDEFKYYVKADFFDPNNNYATDIKIRYRGTNSNNWDAEKNAFRIKFPKDNLWQGQRSLNLFLPYDRAYFGEMLDSYRAKKLGIFHTDFNFVKIIINGRNMGVYLASEPWSKELLARTGQIDTNNIFSNKDNITEDLATRYSEDGLSEWKSYTAEIEDGPFPELKALFRLINQSNDEEFAKKIGALVDLDKFYRWYLINVLASSNHQNDFDNAVILFRQETGKFELVPWDVNFNPPKNFNITNTTILAKRILSHQPFYDDFLSVLNNYVNNENNLADDLKFYNNLYKKTKKEFYKDQAKLHNDIMFKNEVEEISEWITKNFENAKNIVQKKKTPFISEEPNLNITKNEVIFEDSFEYFNNIFLDIDTFVKKNAQFKKINDSTIELSAGKHVFKKTIIIPQKLKLTIKPGAKLLFGSGASLISYSPITAEGTHEQQIIIDALDVNNKEPWGVFAVINTNKEENSFKQIRVSNGSIAKINGVLFTSQFSLHNAISKIEHSVFYNSKSDDSFHAILGKIIVNNCVFKNNLSDGIDIDFVKNTTISNNKFLNESDKNSNGDAIDVSFVKNTIIKNNEIINYGDKCISVGEMSNLEINNNTLYNCNIGIAIKDSSKANINNNIIIGNKATGVTLYRKKQEFIKGGYANINNSIFWYNNEDIKIDDYSEINIKNSIIESGYPGGGNNSEKPKFEDIISDNILLMIKANYE